MLKLVSKDTGPAGVRRIYDTPRGRVTVVWMTKTRRGAQIIHMIHHRLPAISEAKQPCRKRK